MSTFYRTNTESGAVCEDGGTTTDGVKSLLQVGLPEFLGPGRTQKVSFGLESKRSLEHEKKIRLRQVVLLADRKPTLSCLTFER